MAFAQRVGNRQRHEARVDSGLEDHVVPAERAHHLAVGEDGVGGGRLVRQSDQARVAAAIAEVSGDGNSTHHVGLVRSQAAKGQAEVIGEALPGALASGSIDVRELLVTNICCEFLTECGQGLFVFRITSCIFFIK